MGASQFSVKKYAIIIIFILLVGGCTRYQPTKDVWKTTKGLWNTYVSPPANLNYDEKGDISPEGASLAKSMMPIDAQLSRLERVMQNADKPPTQAWIDKFFSDFPWINGFAGVKYDGTILGQQPAESLKKLDFIPLLYEDKRQNSRALRADVELGPLGPEIMLATPLYDGVDFLGIVVAYFDMRSLMTYSKTPDDIVVLTPLALLWPGKYDFAATPLAGVDWAKTVRESHAGTCSNSHGSFYYIVRYLGNLPLIFAVPVKGDFPEGNGSLEQGLAYFPQEKEKLPPPPVPERKSRMENAVAFEKPETEEEQQAESAPEAQEAPVQAAETRSGKRDPNEISPGSRESVLLRGSQRTQRRQIEERQLEGDNVEIERIQPPRRAQRQRAPEPSLELLPTNDAPTLSDGRPSPFGRQEDRSEPAQRPSPFGPDHAPGQDLGSAAAKEIAPAPAPVEAETPSAPGQGEPESAPAQPETATAEPEKSAEEPESRAPALLPDGRPSPFGPRN